MRALAQACARTCDLAPGRRAAAAAAAWKDPHSISNELDAETSRAIVKRLESRGKDPIFCSLFDSYFPHVLDNCTNVLEVGAGTGVVCRALMKRGYRGQLLGTDQSKVFVDAATELAASEGFASLRFAVADARALSKGVQADNFDGVLMHTLLSHVDDPLHVLKSAREVAKAGASLVVVDGDYMGLSYHSPSKQDLSQVMSKALVTATFCSPTVMRDLPSLLADSGWAIQSANGHCVSEIGEAFSYWRTFAEAYMPRVIGSGRVEEAKVREWWSDQLELARQKRFFAACTYYTVIAHAV